MDSLLDRVYGKPTMSGYEQKDTPALDADNPDPPKGDKGERGSAPRQASPRPAIETS